MPVRRCLEMRERRCDLAGTRKNSKCMSVSKSGVRTHRTQSVNLQKRKFWWEEGNTYVRLRVAARTLKTIRLKGITAVAKQYGVNLKKYTISTGTGKPKDEDKVELSPVAPDPVAVAQGPVGP